MRCETVCCGLRVFAGTPRRPGFDRIRAVEAFFDELGRAQAHSGRCDSGGHDGSDGGRARVAGRRLLRGLVAGGRLGRGPGRRARGPVRSLRAPLEETFRRALMELDEPARKTPSGATSSWARRSSGRSSRSCTPCRGGQHRPPRCTGRGARRPGAAAGPRRRRRARRIRGTNRSRPRGGEPSRRTARRRARPPGRALPPSPPSFGRPRGRGVTVCQSSSLSLH